MVRLERRKLEMDCFARDEILAYYKEGRDTKNIYDTLTASPLYDYKLWFKEQLKALPERIVKDLNEYLRVLIPETLTVEEPKGGEIKVERIEELEVKTEEVHQAIEMVFDSEYKRKDLRQWLDSIDLLETKDYSPKEIMGLLYQTPVNRWQRLAERQ